MESPRRPWRPNHPFNAARPPHGAKLLPGSQRAEWNTCGSQTSLLRRRVGARAMHSLQSYKKDEPVYDNNAYAMTSTYQDGTLKMYTSHVAQPCSPGGRPEYHMTQLNGYNITGNRNTCLEGLRAYRNGREWAEKLNRQTREHHVEADAPSPALSFVTAVSETEAYTMSQESRTSLNEDSNTLGDSQQSDSSTEELADYTLPAKRSDRKMLEAVDPTTQASATKD
ncbi:hypothetical protein K469DRAFT_769804 [Zopfia rhizophila CBS 207.26]|uniref:Uncharacterized protein n=1 Tax=Zopfia rhizophila CBS 207.26 TaxID=1314779 RepID=A0A6A6EBJ9_9PEZI|nr:hypothetical protein K469DRAFT_769804 [Zopfia rhizophila CBS 207.26]